ncbi:MAG: pantoate--beta-alanine ligase [Gemmatimonadota bacterium]
MIVVRTRGELGRSLTDARHGDASLGLVPTMGHLHEGHLSLVDTARQGNDRVAVSIFVNPLQFGPSEDLDSYPRNEERDLEALEARGADLVFVPTVEEIYPRGGSGVTVSPGPLEDRLCGAFRPGHFRGVLTVVAKLFGLFRPSAAVFGRKDFQQAVLIKHMVDDLDMGVRVVTAPIVREPDGLALSSRNAYLSADERGQAAGLHSGLMAAAKSYADGERNAMDLLAEARRVLDLHPLVEPQYLEAVDPLTLDPVERAASGTVIAVAAFCGRTRLIDNLELP